MSFLSTLLKLFRHHRSSPSPQPENFQLVVYLEDQATGMPLIGTVTYDGPSAVSAVAIHSIQFSVPRASFLGMNVRVHVDGYADPVSQPVTNPPEDTVLLHFKLTAIPKPMETVGAEHGVLTGAPAGGIYILQADGQPWSGIGVTAFSAFLMWLDGRKDEVKAFADWMIREDINYARVLGMFNKGSGQGVGILIPQAWPNYWTELEEFFTYFADRRLRILFDCVADRTVTPLRDPNPLMDIVPADFYRRVATLVLSDGYWHVMVGGGNQWQGNGFYPGDLVEVPGVFCLRGSGNEETLPFLPPFKGAAQFDGGRSEFFRKGKAVKELRDGDTSEGLRVPGSVIMNEWIGVANYADGGTTNDPALVYDAYGTVRAVGAAAACIHVRDFISALTLPTPGSATEQCVRAAVRAWREIPNRYALGSYQRGEGAGGNHSIALAHTDAMASRTYELANGPTLLVWAVGRTPAWTRQFQGNVTLVASYGYDAAKPNFFDMTRA